MQWQIRYRKSCRTLQRQPAQELLEPEKGALEGRATQITEEMKLAAAEALAHLVSDEELNDEFIMPEAFDPRVAEVVSQAVKSHIVK